jgi:TonB family protein
MKGRTIQVTFFVLADGRVDNVVFAEALPDRGYAKKLEQVLRAYRFRPARSPDGLPVPGHTTVSISF